MIHSVVGSWFTVHFAIGMHPSGRSLPVSYGHDADATLRRETCERLYLSTEWTVAVAADGSTRTQAALLCQIDDLPISSQSA